MKKDFLTSLLFISLSFYVGCGKKGDLLPPLVRFPQTVEGLRAVQRADRIVLTWQNPTAYEDGSTLSMIEKIEIWVLEEDAAGEAKTTEVAAEKFAEIAMLRATVMEDQIKKSADQVGAPQGRMDYSFDISGKEALSKKYTFGIRVKDKKRFSSFSALVSIKPTVLPLPPTEVNASAFPDRITITWHAPLKNRDQSTPAHVKGYNIYRSEGDQEPNRLNEKLIKGEKYADKNFVFGKAYRYIVRATATDTPPYLESEDSEKADIMAEDRFPPRPPTGLLSVAGQDFLAISWDANTEVDLEGYRVWRRVEGAEDFSLLTPNPIKESAYNDRAVERGRTYTYAVTALDESGNESPKSETITGRIRRSIR